jgi:hypothetical protein
MFLILVFNIYSVFFMNLYLWIDIAKLQLSSTHSTGHHKRHHDDVMEIMECSERSFQEGNGIGQIYIASQIFRQWWILNIDLYIQIFGSNILFLLKNLTILFMASIIVAQFPGTIPFLKLLILGSSPDRQTN